MSQATPHSHGIGAVAAPPVRKTLSVPKPSHRPPVVGDATTMVSSDHLLQGAPCVGIAHNGQVYQLRATRHGKLILTK